MYFRFKAQSKYIRITSLTLCRHESKRAVIWKPCEVELLATGQTKNKTPADDQACRSTKPKQLKEVRF